MPCVPLKNAEGYTIGVKCYRTIKCHVCGKPYTSLCDAIKNDGTPCDMPMCDEHKHNIAEDTDVCKYHNYPKFIDGAIKRRSEIK